MTSASTFRRRELYHRLLVLPHADHFSEGRREFVFELHGSAGEATTPKFYVFPEALQSGMQVMVTGRAAADGPGVVPDTATIVGLPAQTSLQTDLTRAPVTNNVLVILMTFTDTPGVPFSQAEVQGVLSGGPRRLLAAPRASRARHRQHRYQRSTQFSASMARRGPTESTISPTRPAKK